MHDLISRRRFLARSAAAAAAWAWPSSVPPAASRWPLHLHLVLDSSRGPPSADAARGAEMGLREAALAARLFDREIRHTRDPDLPWWDRASGVAVVIGGAAPTDMERLAAATPGGAVTLGPVYLNVLDASVARRGACAPRLFHVVASDGMKRRARELTQSGADATVLEWHPLHHRFGADSLSRRYRDAYGTQMTASAWCGWMAVKIAWEASVRSRGTDPATLSSHLLRPATTFDGHKGVPLSFHATRQLLQPLYVTGGGELQEAPPPSGGPAAARLARLIVEAEEGEAC